MADYGRNYADRRESALVWRLRRVYREAQRDLNRKADQFVRSYAKQEREKQRQLKDGKITEDQYNSWRMSKEFAGKQWNDKVNSMTETLLHSNERSLEMIRGEQYKVFSENANFQSYNFEKDFKGGIRFDIYDERTVERLINEKPELLPPKVINGVKDRAWNRGIISNCVTQGILQGESIDEIARRIARNTASRNNSSMRMYARTAMTAAQNAGRLETMHRAEDMGIKVKKQWLATLDKRTRHAHAELDGQAIDIDEPFVNSIGEIDYPGDPDADNENVWNCRCTLTYEYPDYSHMPEQENNVRYDQEYDEEIEFMDYDEWKDWKEELQSYYGSNRPIEKYLQPEYESDEDRLMSLLGVKKINGNHNIEDDMKAVNPGYDPSNFATSQNCQRCVNAYIARRRGYDVRASQIYAADDIYAMGSGYRRCYNTDATPTHLASSIFDKLTQAEARKRFETAMQGKPDGSIVILAGHWELSGAGHLFIAEKRNGGIAYVDPQSGQTADSYLDWMTPRTVSYFDTTNIPFNNHIMDLVEVNK